MGLFDDLMGSSAFCCSHSRSSSNPKPKPAIASYALSPNDKSNQQNSPDDSGFPPLPQRSIVSSGKDISEPTVCGIGIVFQDSHEQGLFVSSLVLDGPAYQSKVIQQGDVLLRIDNSDVRKSKAADLGNQPSEPLSPNYTMRVLTRLPSN